MNIYEKYPDVLYLKSLRARESIVGARERIAELFTALDGLEDPDFGPAFDGDPEARIWEMMVATILKSSGLALTGFKKRGPDFAFNLGDKRVLVEAVCPSEGDPARPDSVPPLLPSRDFQLVPVDPMLLRVRGAFDAKKNAFARYRAEGIIREDEPCIIAISSSKLSHAQGTKPPLGVTAMLGHGAPYMAFDRRKQGPAASGYTFKGDVRKANGSPVEMMAFLDVMNASISGVLYSDSKATSVPFDLHGDSYFIHNPHAIFPVSAGTIKVGHELVTTITADGGWRTDEY